MHQSTTYMNAREVTQLMALRPGEYLLVPSTSNPNEEASYYLTIMSKSDVHTQYATQTHKSAEKLWKQVTLLLLRLNISLSARQ